MITIKRVLVATDFSPVAETALVYGRQLARTFGAQLQVLHVVDDFSRFNYADGAGLLPPTAFREEIERAGREKLEALMRDDDRRELRAVTVLGRAQHRQRDRPVRRRRRHRHHRHRRDRTRRARPHADGQCGRQGDPPGALSGTLTVHHPEHEFVGPDALQVVGRVTA